MKDDTHHRYFIYHTLSGQKTSVKTHTSHGHKEISDAIISKMAQQCGLRNSEFKLLIECPLTQTKYEGILHKNGKIRFN